MLNAAQQQAVRVNGHCLITACPGSGKTTVLQHRAAFLLGTPGSRVLGVTFSSESAKELDVRIRKAVPDAGDRVVCGTFHALCKRQLEKAGQRFRLVSDVQQVELMRRAFVDACDEDGTDYDACVHFIDMTKGVVDPMMPSAHLDVRVRVYERYQALLARMGAYDFADLLRLAVRGMRLPPGADGHVEHYAVTHMLVDEFQDTDEVQYAWMKEHIRRGVLVTVVGDDDQSIFSFRAALAYRGLDDFRILTQASHISLDTSYRFPREIMAPAARLIVNNTERIPKALVTANRSTGSVRVVACDSTRDQMIQIVTAVRSSGTPGEWAVLARTNAQLETLETLIPADMPTIRHGGKSFWELPISALFLSLVRAVGLGDMPSLDFVLKTAGADEQALADLHRACQSTRTGAVQRFTDGKKRASKTTPVERLRDYLKQWAPLLDKHKNTDVDNVLNGMVVYLKQYVLGVTFRTHREPRERDAMRLDACAHSLKRLKGPLSDRIDALDKKAEKADAVRLMTMHAAKGLEFNYVWVIGCEDGVVPSQRGILEEERRLFYVAMTRAKSHLVVSYITSDKTKPSPFLYEAGLFHSRLRQTATA